MMYASYLNEKEKKKKEVYFRGSDVPKLRLIEMKCVATLQFFINRVPSQLIGSFAQDLHQADRLALLSPSCLRFYVQIHHKHGHSLLGILHPFKTQ